MVNQNVQPSPTLFFNTVNAYQRTAVIKAAVELEIFTAIVEGKQTSADELAVRCQTSERGMRILCDYLVVMGFLTKAAGCYGLTEDSKMFLDRSSPGYIGSSIEFLLSPLLTEGFKDITAAVRKGGTVMPLSGTLAPDHPLWVDFAKAMAPMMALPAQLLAQLVPSDASRKLKVLDIAASHGLFGIAFAQQHPQAEIVAVDWSPVLQVAQANAQSAGVAVRYSTIAGSAFEVDFGRDYDLVLLPNFLHHFDVATCETLLRKVHTALAENGKVVTFEFIPNQDRISPAEAATFSMVMLATTPCGDAYTFVEYEHMFGNAGFSLSELHLLPPTMQQVVISSK